MTHANADTDPDPAAVAAVLAALRAGPQGYGLPVVSKALPLTAYAVGGPLFDALTWCRAVGLIRVIPHVEADARGLTMNGWSLCEDVR